MIDINVKTSRNCADMWKDEERINIVCIEIYFNIFPVGKLKNRSHLLPNLYGKTL